LAAVEAAVVVDHTVALVSPTRLLTLEAQAPRFLLRFEIKGRVRSAANTPFVSQPHTEGEPGMINDKLDSIKEELGSNLTVRKPIPYPNLESPIDAIRNVAEEYGRRKAPPNVPTVLQEVVFHLRAKQNELLTACAESMVSTEALIADIVQRSSKHIAYLEREKQIADTVKIRAESLRKELTNEFSEPEKTTT
jgi:hypothetical protein